jgi:hypothetical protein
MAGRQEDAVPERPDRTSARPMKARPPEGRTVAALWSGVLATALAVPAFIDSFSWSIGPEDPGPHGWPIALWYASFIVGVISMSSARIARSRERFRNSPAGEKLAKRVVRLDIVGSCIWGVPLIVMLGRGL